MGAEVRTRTRCDHAERDDAGGWRITLADEETGVEETVSTRALVNAAGPWVSRFIKDGLKVESRHRVRLVKGSHIVVPALYDGDHAYILQNDDQRIVFAIPYQAGRLTIIGTTDLAYEGEPAAVEIDRDEIDYLCRVVNRYFKKKTSAEDIVWTYSGVRPLYDDQSGNPSAVTRDYVFDLDAPEGEGPLLSVFGGKLTTYRKLAEHAMQKLAPVMGLDDRSWTADAHLPGGDIPNADFEGFKAELGRRYPFLPELMLERIAHAYGTRAGRVLGDARSLADLGEHIGGDLYARELDHLVREEWARRPEDVLWRRTKLGLFVDDEAEARLRAWFARNEEPERMAVGR
jgi:glycerol-3-phosphate dehydrogenase